MKRAFASLSAQEALHVAIFIEKRNANIYRQFSEMFGEFRDPESLEMASAFWEMSNEERSHGTTLQKRYFDRYGSQACTVTEEDISDFIEVPRLEDGRFFAIDELKTGRSPKTMALEIAAAAEDSASVSTAAWRRPARMRSSAPCTGNSSISRPTTLAGWTRNSRRFAKPPTGPRGLSRPLP